MGGVGGGDVGGGGVTIVTVQWQRILRCAVVVFLASRPLSRRRVKSAKLRVRRSSPDSIAATDTDALLDLDLDSPDNDAGSAAGVPAHDGRAAAAEARRDARIEQLHDDMRNLTMHVKAISNSLAAMQNEWD